MSRPKRAKRRTPKKLLRQSGAPHLVRNQPRKGQKKMDFRRKVY